MRWLRALQARYADREALNPGELLARFKLPALEAPEELLEVLAVFEQEYGISSAKLRPQDPISWFLAPPRTRNPFRWLMERGAFEDAWSELDYHVKLSRKARGLPDTMVETNSIGDYVAACLGIDLPRSGVE